MIVGSLMLRWSVNVLFSHPQIIMSIIIKTVKKKEKTFQTINPCLMNSWYLLHSLIHIIPEYKCLSWSLIMEHEQKIHKNRKNNFIQINWDARSFHFGFHFHAHMYIYHFQRFYYYLSPFECHVVSILWRQRANDWKLKIEISNVHHCYYSTKWLILLSITKSNNLLPTTIRFRSILNLNLPECFRC